jgi:hypothetical protein
MGQRFKAGTAIVVCLALAGALQAVGLLAQASSINRLQQNDANNDDPIELQLRHGN